MPRHSADEFSKKREEVYKLLIRYVEMSGAQPSLADIGAMLGVTPRSAHDRIQGLKKTGLIGDSDKPSGERSLKLIGIRFKGYQVRDDGAPEFAKVVTIDGVPCFITPLSDEHPLLKYHCGIELQTGDVPLIQHGDPDD